MIKAYYRAKLFGEDQTGDNAEKTGESISSGTTYSPKVRGPKMSGRMSIHIAWDASITGTFTLWYTNLENPSLADDADWVQDTTWAPTNPAASAGKTFVTTGNLTCTHFRVKFVFTSGGPANFYGWASVEE